MSDNMQSIRALENKYGLMLFRMSLTHLMDVGVRYFIDNDIEPDIAQIMAQGEADKANGVHPVITPEFKCDIVRCAADLSAFSIWTLFEYIKKHVVVCNDSNAKYLLINCYNRGINIPKLYNNIDEAQDALRMELIGAMEGVDDSVFDEYDEDDEFDLDSSSASFSDHHGNYDWKIFELLNSGEIRGIDKN